MSGRGGAVVAREPGVSVSARLLRLLGAFSDERPAMTFSELVRRAGLPPSTGHRLIDELCLWGALERDQQRHYRIGRRLAQIAALAPRQPPELYEAAAPFVDDLHEVTGLEVQLAVREAGEALLIRSLPARGRSGTPWRAGSRIPLHATAFGLVLLAGAGRVRPGQLVYAGHGDTHTPSPRWLRRGVADPTEARVAVSDVPGAPMARCLAVPVKGPDDQVVASLSIVVSTGDPALRHVPTLRATARAASRALGWRPTLVIAASAGG